MDLFLTNAVYLAFYDIYGNLMNIGHLDVDFMDIFFSESFQVIVAIMFLLVLFQVLGLVDLAHGERDLSFYYSQVDAGKISHLGWSSTWEVKRLAGSELGGLALHAVNDEKEHVDIYRVRCVVQNPSYTSKCTSLTRYQPNYA